jgi:mono/diheme cytochrome c family protein
MANLVGFIFISPEFLVGWYSNQRVLFQGQKIFLPEVSILQTTPMDGINFLIQPDNREVPMRLIVTSLTIIASLGQVACGVSESSSQSRVNSVQRSVTVDTGNTLRDILEYDSIKDACALYWAQLDEKDQPKPDADSEELQINKIKCGKWLFIGWETSGKMPLPQILFDAIERSWPERVGRKFAKLGFLENPEDPSGLPLGIAKSTTKYTGMPSVNVTCAACHIGQLPDGRFAVGAPNTELHLSEFNLMSYYPLFAAMHKSSREKLPVEIQNYYIQLEKTERRRITGGNSGIDWSNVVFKYSKLLRWIGVGPKGLPDAEFVVMPPDRDLKSWLNGRPGVFNPGAPMLTLQIDDVPNLSIPQLWGITGYEQDFNSGKAAPLGQTTKYASLEKFISSAFVYSYQDLSLVRPKHVEPLAAYIRQLKTPQIKKSIPLNAIQSGHHLFEVQCRSCHDGAHGESTRLYPAEMTQTHPSLASPRTNYRATTPIAQLIDQLSQQLAADLSPQPSGIRSRRLTGIWSRKNLMIDGSFESIDDLFCLNDSRKTASSPHQNLCSILTPNEKNALKAYLQTL